MERLPAVRMFRRAVSLSTVSSIWYFPPLVPLLFSRSAMMRTLEEMERTGWKDTDTQAEQVRGIDRKFEETERKCRVVN
jgi:hypothetical protein